MNIKEFYQNLLRKKKPANQGTNFITKNITSPQTGLLAQMKALPEFLKMQSNPGINNTVANKFWQSKAGDNLTGWQQFPKKEILPELAKIQQGKRINISEFKSPPKFPMEYAMNALFPSVEKRLENKYGPRPKSIDKIATSAANIGMWLTPVGPGLKVLEEGLNIGKDVGYIGASLSKKNTPTRQNMSSWSTRLVPDIAEKQWGDVVADVGGIGETLLSGVMAGKGSSFKQTGYKPMKERIIKVLREYTPRGAAWGASAGAKAQSGDEVNWKQIYTNAGSGALFSTIMGLGFETLTHFMLRKSMSGEYSTARNKLADKLGIDRNAPIEEFKRAYIDFAKRYHPDVISDKSNKTFQEVSSLWDIVGKMDKYNLRYNPNATKYEPTKPLLIGDGTQQNIIPSATSKIQLDNQEVKGGDLISEARKYKSADEFVRAKTNAYHQTNSDIKVFNDKSPVFFNGENRPPTFGNKTIETFVNFKKPYEAGEYVPPSVQKTLIPKLQKEGYDGVIFRSDPNNPSKITMSVSLKPSENTFTKSQLTDIWNQANKVGGVPEGYKKLYHVTTPESAKAIRETGVPEVPSGRGFFAFNNKQYAEEWARISGEKSEIVEVTAKPWNIKNPESRMKTVTQKDGKPLYDVVFSKDDFIPNKPKQIKIKSPETKLEPVKQQSIEEAFPQAEIEKSLEDEIRQSANIKEPSFIPRKIEEPKLNVLQKIKQSWNRVFDPKATLPKNSQEAVTKWNATQQMAKTDANYLEREGNLVASKVGIQDPELKEKLLYYSQNPTESSAKELDLSPEVIKQAQPYLNWHKEFNDEIFSMYKEGLLDAKGNPINIGYLKNHVFQLFEERPEIIEKLIKDRGLSTYPGFAKHRIIPDFQTAKKLGLHPKYTTMEQLDAALLEVFGKSKANIDFSKYLAETGDLVAFGDAPSNWQPITSRFFPKAPNGEIFYASPDLAKTLNNIFGADTTKSFIDRGLETTAKISGTMQDVKLTGGAYTINAFTIGQTIRDTALGLGEIAKLHPIKGGKIIEASWETMFRNLTPGASQRFELNPDNKQAVKELINEGWNYGGDLNYRKAQPNTSISKDLKDSINGEGLKNTWDEISNRPTFRKYLWQKRVDIFKIVRDDLVSKGKSYDEAVKLAAANTKNYEGVISDLGRDKSVQNFLQTFVMAPKYREGLLKSGQNIVKGFTTQIKNPEFAQSRSLGIGMGLLFVLYDQLNRKFNEGKHLWENPPGKELELVIPDGEGGYTSIPFMPGTTAIYRRAFGSIAALYKGDVQEAGKQASSLLSIPVSGMSTLVTGKDYWGNDVYDPNRPSVFGGPASKTEQMGIQAIKSFAPGYVEQPIQYAQDMASYKYRKDVLNKKATEPNKIKYGLRALEIPVKQGTFSPAYFTAKDEVLKKYSKEDVAAYEATHPTTGTFERKEPKTDIEKMKINLDKATNPNIYMMEKEIALKEAELSKKEVDPLYKVPMEVALRMYKYDSYEPGSKDKKDYGKAHPEIFELKDLREAFFKENPIENGTPYQGPVASEYVQKQMDLKNWKDPQVKAYLEANREYTNERRKALGLEPLAAYSGGSGGYNPMKYFKPKVKTVKMKKLRLKKLPKIKKAKRKTYKKIATKKITIKPIKGIKIKKLKSIGKIKVRS